MKLITDENDIRIGRTYRITTDVFYCDIYNFLDGMSFEDWCAIEKYTRCDEKYWICFRAGTTLTIRDIDYGPGGGFECEIANTGVVIPFTFLVSDVIDEGCPYIVEIG